MSLFNLSFLELVVNNLSGVSLKWSLPPTKMPKANASAMIVGNM